MKFALLALVGLLVCASDASAFFGRRGRSQQVVVQPQRVVVQQRVVHPQRVVVQQAQQFHAQPQRIIVQQVQQHHAQPVILQQVVPAYQFFSR